MSFHKHPNLHRPEAASQPSALPTQDHDVEQQLACWQGRFRMMLLQARDGRKRQLLPRNTMSSKQQPLVTYKPLTFFGILHSKNVVLLCHVHILRCCAPAVSLGIACKLSVTTIISNTILMVASSSQWTS